MPASGISPTPGGRSCAGLLLTPARYSERVWLQRAHERGVALAAAATQGSGAEPAAPAAQLVDQRGDEARPRHADRVTERDRAAVDVDDVVVDAQVAHGRESHGGERLVDLEQVDVGDRPVDRA